MCVSVCVLGRARGPGGPAAGGAGALCGVALGPLFGYPVVLRSVGQVLCGDAPHQRVG